MPHCCVVECNNRAGSGRSFFRFPTEKERRQEWIESVRRIDWEPSRTTVICSDHFSRDAFVIDPEMLKTLGYLNFPGCRQRRLKKTATPSIFTYTDELAVKLRAFRRRRQMKPFKEKMSTKNVKPSFSAYRCHYCAYKASSFQNVVGHCVGSHAEFEIAVCQPVLDHSTGRLLTKRQRFGITPKKHLKSGQKIVCSLDRLALGVIDIDSNVGVQSVCTATETDQRGLKNDHRSPAKVCEQKASDIEKKWLARHQNGTTPGKDDYQKNVRRKGADPGDKKEAIGPENSQDEDSSDDESSEKGSDNEAEEKASLQLYLPVSDWLSDDEGKAADQCERLLKQPQENSVIGDVGSGAAQPVEVVTTATTVVMTATTVDHSIHTDSVTTVSNVCNTNTSSNSTLTPNGGVLPVGQLMIQNSGWASRLTQCVPQTTSDMILLNDNTSKSEGVLKLMPEDKVCLVPVDVSTGQIVQNLPKLLVPLQHKTIQQSLVEAKHPVTKKRLQAMTTPGDRAKQHLKIVSVKSLAKVVNVPQEAIPEPTPNQQLTLTFRLPTPDSHSASHDKTTSPKVTSGSSSVPVKDHCKNAIVQLPYPGAASIDSKRIYAIHQEPCNMPLMHQITESDPPNMLEIGGVTVENSDLLSQAVWFKGGERAVNCITYSYDTTCHMTSPGLIITPRVVDGEVPLDSEICEVRTRRFKKIQLSESGPDMCSLPAKTIPMLVSEQSLQSFSDMNKKQQKYVLHAAEVDDETAAADVDDDVRNNKESEKQVEAETAEVTEGLTTHITHDHGGPTQATTDAVSDAAKEQLTTDTNIDIPLEPVGGDTNESSDTAGETVQPLLRQEATVGNERDASDVSVGILRKMLQKGDLDSSMSDDELYNISGDDWQNQYGCYLCKFISSSVDGVTRHWVREHVSQKPYLCSHCHAVFSTSYKARSHIQKFHGGREITIGLKQSEVYRTPLIFEMERPENMTSNSCWEELRRGSGAGFYEDEEEQHQGQFFCRKCNFACSSTYVMKRHIREQHLQYRPFSCTHCHATFTCSYDMKRHLVAKHADVNEGDTLMMEEPGKGLGNIFLVNPYRMGEGWEICSTGTTTSMLCRRCNFVTTTRRVIYEHVMEKHPRPDSIACVCCKTTVSTKFNQAGRSLVVRCPRCGAKLQLCTDNDTLPTSAVIAGQGHLVHICKICDYKTREKSGMTRHIKYNHTQCRPYLCPYCTYAAVERPKVRIHIASNHRGKPMRVNKSERAVQEFRDNIAALFKKLTFTVNDKDEVDLYEGEGQEYGADLGIDSEAASLMPSLREKRRVSTVRELLRAKRRRMKKVSQAESDEDRNNEDMSRLRLKRSFSYRKKLLLLGTHSAEKLSAVQCTVCQATFRSPAACWKHTREVHHLKVSNREEQEDEEEAKTGGVKRLIGEHFRCNLCGYRCHDRSCMARHIKYMHLTGRPHSCPFCEYTNVEKTKVRLHVRAGHPNKPQRVNTDDRMLVMLSAEVKKHYTKINHCGKSMPEKLINKFRGPASVYPRSMQSKYRRKQLLSSRALQQMSASPMAPTVMSPQTSFQAVPRILVMNVHSEDPRVKTELKSDDDAEVKQEPANEPSDTEFSFIVKSEPVDGGYEVCGAVGDAVDDTEPGVEDIARQWVDTNVVHIQPTDESMEVDLDITGTKVKQEAGSSCKSTGRLWCNDWTVDYVDYDELNANSVRCSSVDINDTKLKMRPVVVLEDIVEKILSASYTAPPVGMPPVGTDEQMVSCEVVTS